MAQTTMKLEAKVRILRAPWFHPLWWIGAIAIKLGADEERVVNRIASLAGVVVISCFGSHSFHLLRQRRGEFELKEFFTCSTRFLR